MESRDSLPGPDAWLLARRSISDPSEMAYYPSNAPLDVSLLKLGQVASTRFTVEQCIEEGKGETGTDEYEVRYWHSWYRHITLSMMAHVWLASIRLKDGQKGGSRSRLGRTDRARGAAIVGSSHALATTLAGTTPGLVMLASSQTAAGTLQPLPQQRVRGSA